VPSKAKDVVTTMILFGTGSRYESEEKAGISHILEHMFFKGSKKRPTAIELAEFIESLGGENNAFTSKEYTGYFAKVASKYLDKAIEYLSDLLSEPLFLAEELEREKGVILQELDMYEDQPMEVVNSKFDLALLGKNSLGRDVIGYKDSILSVNHDDLFEYKDRQYTASNTVLVIAGNFGELSLEDLLQQIEKSFIFPEKTADKYQPIQINSGKNRTIFHKDIEQSHLILGFPGASYENTDRHALKMLSLILGGSMSSRMFVQIREKRGLAYAVRTSSGSYLDAGTIETYAGVPHARVDETIEAITNEYKKIKEDLSLDEVKRAKQIIYGRMLISLEDTSEIANSFAMPELLTGKIVTPAEALAIYEKIEREDLIRVAQKYLDLDKLSMAYVGPKKF
jgi:predicted Zn-dependent peptidase